MAVGKYRDWGGEKEDQSLMHPGESLLIVNLTSSPQHLQKLQEGHKFPSKEKLLHS